MTLEEWWNNNAKEINRRYEDGTLHDFIWDTAYSAGVQDERVRCHKIMDDLCECHRYEQIAAAIRG